MPAAIKSQTSTNARVHNGIGKMKKHTIPLTTSTKGMINTTGFMAESSPGRRVYDKVNPPETWSAYQKCQSRFLIQRPASISVCALDF